MEEGVGFPGAHFPRMAHALHDGTSCFKLWKLELVAYFAVRYTDDLLFGLGSVFFFPFLEIFWKNFKKCTADRH